ncbi:MAG TPA: ABC transporter permease [Chitinophagaceae bacterium]|nr:ABC transporter permease [Chitinophagaceae bacterium]
MLKSFFKTGWRSIKRNKMYSFINVFGLSVGIASCILIGLYITDELSYDKFNTNSDRIVRVVHESAHQGTVETGAVTGTKAGPQLKRTFSFVEDYARLINTTRVVKYKDRLFTEKNVLYADAPFFKIFSFSLLQGDAADVLSQPNEVVITRSMADKYFGSENPVGKTLNFGTRGDYIVTGVCKDVPGNSQIQFDFVASFTSLPASKTEEWWTQNYITYLLLHKGTNIADAQKQVDNYMRGTVTRELKLGGSTYGNDYLSYNLEPLLTVHLHSPNDGLEPNGNINYVYIMLAIGLLILVIACINYTNLTTAQSATRLGEIGMRKVMGAQRWQLFGQFVGESGLVTFIALILALVTCTTLLPLFNSITGKALTTTTLLAPLPILSMLVLGVIVSFIACAYPAFILSGTRLSKILKTGFSFSKSGNALRKSLIVAQFVISVFLIIATIVVQEQLHYMQHKSLGYDKEHVLVLPLDATSLKNYDGYKAGLKQIAGVENVASAYESPVDIGWGDMIKKTSESSDKGISVNALPVDLDFVNTMKIPIIAGTNFTRADFAAMDTSNDGANYHYSFIINESLAKALGYTPEEAINKTIYKNFPGTIKAVVKDFHFTSLHETIKPLAMFLNDGMLYSTFVRINSPDIAGTINKIGAYWKARVPDRAFEYHFLDEDYNNLYKAEQKTAYIFSVFAVIALVLACLGLFGLAAFTTVQRTKEIGVRKVLGAGVATIINLLCREFLQLVIIAFIIAAPVAWLVSQKWLQDFAYRININWLIFAGAGVSVMAVTLFTVGYHALKAALSNPVKSLRTE